MKTTFDLDSHLADLSGSTIQIVGKSPDHKPYVRIELPRLENVTSSNTCLFIEDKDLERFAINILKAIKSKALNP
jgi:hypothetical protein